MWATMYEMILNNLLTSCKPTTQTTFPRRKSHAVRSKLRAADVKLSATD